jgi:hypothetical protein
MASGAAGQFHASMAMGMMHVGDVRVFVPRGFMVMQVRVRLSRRVARSMSVVVVLIVPMRVRMPD